MKVEAIFPEAEISFEVRYGLDKDLSLEFIEEDLVECSLLYTVSEELYKVDPKVVEFISSRLQQLYDRTLQQKNITKLVFVLDKDLDFVVKVLGKWTKQAKGKEKELNWEAVLKKAIKENRTEMVEFFFNALVLREISLQERNVLIFGSGMYRLVRFFKEMQENPLKRATYEMLKKDGIRPSL